MKDITTKQWAYFLLRLTVGVNFFGHGLVRLPKIGGFRDWMVELFNGSLLPTSLVSAFATALPVLEFSVGLLMILGWFTKQALSGAALLICALIWGSCLIEKWDMAGGQMLYALMLFVLLFYVEHNRLSIDEWGRRTK